MTYIHRHTHTQPGAHSSHHVSNCPSSTLASIDIRSGAIGWDKRARYQQISDSSDSSDMNDDSDNDSMNDQTRDEQAENRKGIG